LKLLTITIDTEADCSADWTGAVPEGYRNIEALRARLLPVLGRYNAPATLMLNADIIERDSPSLECERLFRDAGWELGAHLHGEFLEPHRTLRSPAGKRLKDFQCGYDPEIERAKMQNLTAMFLQRFGRRPTCFRAGRFGANRTTFEICLDLGYEVDTSVVPGALLQEGEAVADFRAFDTKPCIAASRAGKRLVEIPVTVKSGLMKPISRIRKRRKEPVGDYFDKWASRFSYGVNCLMRPLNRSIWLRPSYSSAAEMIHILRWLDARNTTHSVVANMMFHSNELMAGASPYNSSEDEVEAFLERVRETVASAAALGYQFQCLTAAGRLVEKEL
jgi:hypothetical protein